jgi:hypothetical protein
MRFCFCLALCLLGGIIKNDNAVLYPYGIFRIQIKITRIVQSVLYSSVLPLPSNF